jgi:hypothetical protein
LSPETAGLFFRFSLVPSETSGKVLKVSTNVLVKMESSGYYGGSKVAFLDLLYQTFDIGTQESVVLTNLHVISYHQQCELLLCPIVCTQLSVNFLSPSF